MKRVAFLLAVAGLLVGAATPAHAWRHSRVFFGPSVFIGAPFFPYWGWGGPYWYPYYAPPPPVVIQETPQVYTQQSAPSQTVQAAPASYWYYCADSKAYYPYVQQCPAGWLKVVPQTTPPGQ